MKYIITENKLKNIIKDKLGLDYTGKVEEVTSVYNLLNYFDECASYFYLNHRLNNFGPMYLITLNNRKKILYQKDLDSDNDWILTNGCDYYDKYDLMNNLGLMSLGLDVDDFINLYLD